jgi:hypothetical protein
MIGKNKKISVNYLFYYFDKQLLYHRLYLTYINNYMTIHIYFKTI